MWRKINTLFPYKSDRFRNTFSPNPHLLATGKRKRFIKPIYKNLTLAKVSHLQIQRTCYTPTYPPPPVGRRSSPRGVGWRVLRKHQGCRQGGVDSTPGRSSEPFLFSVRGVLGCLLYTSPSPRDLCTSRMPSSA